MKSPKKITSDYLHNSGLFYLQKYASSVSNFERVMLKKIQKSCYFHKDQDLKSCVDMLENTKNKFIHLGILNDKNYAEMKVRSMRKEGKSGQIIHQKLKQKGISSSLIEGAIHAYNDHHGFLEQDVDLISALVFCRRKKMGAFYSEPLEDNAQNIYNKWLQTLARQGFSYETSQKALSKTKKEIEEITQSSNQFYS